MDRSAWIELGKRFPSVPAGMQLMTVQERTASGDPIRAHGRPVLALAFSPDSRRIAVSGGGMIPGPADIRVFDVETRELRTICHYHRMGVFALAFDTRTGLLASASHDYSVVLWELEREDAIFLVGGPDAGVSRQAAAFLGSHVVIADGMTFAGEHASLTAIDVETGRRRTLLELDGDLGITHLDVLSRDGLVVIAIDEMRQAGKPVIRILDLEGQERGHLNAEFWMYDLVAVDPATLLATGCIEYAGDTALFVLDVATGNRRAMRTLGDEIGASLAISPGRDLVAVAYKSGVDLCPVRTLEPRLHLDLGAERACSVAWSPDNAWIAVGTVQRTLRLFDAITGREHLD